MVLKRSLLAVVLALFMAGCAGGPVGGLLKDTPRNTLPSLKDAEAVQMIPCPQGPLFRAGFDEKDGRYALMFFGPVNDQDLPVPGYPHVWIRFVGDQPTAVLLVITEKKMAIIGMDELKARFPSVCDLLGVVI